MVKETNIFQVASGKNIFQVYLSLVFQSLGGFPSSFRPPKTLHVTERLST